MIEAFFSNPYAVIGAVLLACFSGYIVYRNNKLSRFAAASAAFRSAFSDAYSKIRNGNDNPFTILTAAFPGHETAVLEFARYLGPIARKGLLEAWRKFHSHEKANIRFLEQYTTTGVSLSQVQSNRKLAIQRIEHLLSYAKQT
jgi:hypothetical protein